MDHLKDRFKIIRSTNFFFFVILLTIIFFLFIDITLFKFSRDLSGILFWFFNEVVNNLAKIFNPLNLGIVLLILLIISHLLGNIIKEPKKRKIVIVKLNCNESSLKESINYYKLIFNHMITSIISTGIVCHLIKFIIGSSRPKYFFLYGYDRIDSFNLVHKMNALPSGHTQASFTLAILFYIYFNRYMILVFTLASLISISRIFMSMHFPSDLISGAYLGTVFPIIIYNLFYKKRFSAFDQRKILKFRIFMKFLWYKIYV